MAAGAFERERSTTGFYTALPDAVHRFPALDRFSSSVNIAIAR
ncbi:hypothetical protein NOV72_00539 [Caballeronia novacaledonica]|uniref:Uncharacterized protein n=1 Tax=Caballeronia novacaledonica TaxID=1544861 RepID=A0A2U3HZK1_9BURK|nr:hypothetical protein NOV72_00539 [Caballeronia novacaledonica]